MSGAGTSSRAGLRQVYAGRSPIERPTSSDEKKNEPDLCSVHRTLSVLAGERATEFSPWPAGPPESMIALSDPPREDAAGVIAEPVGVGGRGSTARVIVQACE